MMKILNTLEFSSNQANSFLLPLLNPRRPILASDLSSWTCLIMLPPRPSIGPVKCLGYHEKEADARITRSGRV
jgi:hypothetical protein